ncbi:hypothetical protein [Limnoglobus roseus]|uniref:Uncharacterized protein n=1 Tax=Limnoglobus roseus TaxID=2598579 RepID=A0A5C1AK85_9BACT|nr:hypothetical protein [Limnoglobus roseus]QEL19085.1 hypothetical protein PX52LOC_06142 [Limnoglobus roseus]
MTVPNFNVQHPASGPADVWMKLGANAWGQLGYTETGVRIDFVPEWIAMPTDRRGPTGADFRVTGGETANVVLTLAEWDVAFYEAAKSRTRNASGAGFYDRRDIGGYATGALQIAVRHQFYGSVAATPGLPPGYLFPNCFITPHSLSPIGTRSPKLAISFEAEPIFDGGLGGWLLYSTATSFFGSLPAPC